MELVSSAAIVKNEKCRKEIQAEPEKELSLKNVYSIQNRKTRELPAIIAIVTTNEEEKVSLISLCICIMKIRVCFYLFFISRRICQPVMR